MNSVLRSSYKTILMLSCYSFLKLFSISKILATRFSSFSATSLIAPAVGAWLTTTELVTITLIRTLMHLVVNSSITFFSIGYYLPSLLSAYYFKTMLNSTSTRTDQIICTVTPLACIMIFVTTQVGSGAWIYCLYWIIPALIAGMPRTNIFLAALGSTFTAHAVGSVLFILSTPMTPLFWIGLIPVVAVERLAFTVGIVGVYYLIQLVYALAKTVSSYVVPA